MRLNCDYICLQFLFVTIFFHNMIQSIIYKSCFPCQKDGSAGKVLTVLALGAQFKTPGPVFKAEHSSTPCNHREGESYMGGSWRLNQQLFLTAMVGDFQFTHEPIFKRKMGSDCGRQLMQTSGLLTLTSLSNILRA